MDSAKVIDLKDIKPIVKSPRLIKQRGFKVKVRVGKGFSIHELKNVGLSLSDAKKLGLPIDKRRRSIREENVGLLKKFLEELTR